MTLKEATVFTVTALSIGLVIDAAQWIVITFNLLPYKENLLLFRVTGLFLILLKYIPLIVFFTVLYSNQKEA